MATKTTKKVELRCDNCGKDIPRGLLVRYEGGYKFQNIEIMPSESGEYMGYMDATIGLPVGEFCDFECYIAYVRKIN